MDNEKQYADAFNNAYMLAQHQPELLNRILSQDNVHEYLNAMKDGRDQFNFDQAKEYFSSMLSSNVQPDNSPDKDKNIDAPDR